MFFKKRKKKYKINVIDGYHLNLYCKCLNCDNWRVRHPELPPYACKAYPKYRGIPKEVWNKPDSECRYYIPVK